MVKFHVPDKLKFKKKNKKDFRKGGLKKNVLVWGQGSESSTEDHISGIYLSIYRSSGSLWAAIGYIQLVSTTGWILLVSFFFLHTVYYCITQGLHYSY